jgi:hypothetical protein
LAPFIMGWLVGSIGYAVIVAQSQDQSAEGVATRFAAYLIVTCALAVGFRSFMPAVAFSEREGRPPFARLVTVGIGAALPPLIGAAVKTAL